MTTIRLTKATGQAWGIRLHGGKDFNQPLIVLKVAGGSIAESSNLSPGDLILGINNVDASNLKHKDAQDLISRSGNTVEFTVQKGTSTWKPNVTPVGAPLTTVGDNRIVTKTSLAKNQPGSGFRVGPGVNSYARPFLVQDGKQVVNNQFNTPINLYSEANIAETLSAQAEVLAGGAIGVNFKKNEKKYNYEDSEVYKMLKSVESEPGHIEIPEDRSRQEQERQPPPQLTQTISQLRPVRAPEPKPVDQPSATTGSSNPNLCAECERLIVGVFVRIKDKNLHVDCFKCATCGQSLKNIGYFNINNKLYCDVHAQTIARNNPIAPGLEPFAQLPTEPLSSSAAPPFSSGLPSSFGSPNVGTNIPVNVKPPSFTSYQPNKPDPYSVNIAPQPFHHSPTAPSHVSAPSKLIQESSFMEKRSFSSETVTKTSPGSKFVWPPLQQGNDDGLIGGGTVIPIQQPQQQQQQQFQQQQQYQPQQLQQSSPSLNNQSSLLNQSSSVFNQSSSFSSGLQQQQQQQQYQPQTMPAYSPSSSSSLYQNLAQPYKPVAPPKPRAPQTPYKPLSTLLAPATKPSAPLTPPIQPPFGATTSNINSSSNVSGLGNALGNLNLKRGQNVSRGVLPNRGRGTLNQPGPRVAVCGVCSRQIRGPFISAGAKFFCPDHFKCGTPNCARSLMEIGFVEERGQLFCEFCWESYLAPVCSKCGKRIKNECLHAIGQSFHSQCFTCAHCHSCFGNSRTFYLEDGLPYCEKDWNEMFTTKCYGCGFPIEAGDRWVEALNQNYHSQCFNCAACKKNLEGQGFFAKAGRPFCRQHAR